MVVYYDMDVKSQKSDQACLISLLTLTSYYILTMIVESKDAKMKGEKNER